MTQLKKTVRAGRLLLGTVSLVVLASCGGHDDGSPTPVAVTPPVATTVPTSAAASTAAFIAYLKTLVAAPSDTTEPLDTTGFVAPTDDTGAFDPSI